MATIRLLHGLSGPAISWAPGTALEVGGDWYDSLLLPDGRVVTTGGRVLGVVAHGPTLQEAARRAYAVVPQIRYEGCHYRRDIGYRQLRRDGVL